MSFVLLVVVVLLLVRVAQLQRRLELVARAEHELRAPLTALMLALPRPARLSGEMARVQAGLADLACARSGQRALPRPLDVSVDRLVGRVAAGWNGRGGGRRVAVDWDAGPALVHADPGRLSQALGNLVANAVEHGSGPVLLRGTAAGDGAAVRIAVEDGGPGLPARPRRFAIRTGRWRSGRGRGLSIAAAAARDAGGTLDARPGAAPALELPLAATPDPRSETAHQQQFLTPDPREPGREESS